MVTPPKPFTEADAQLVAEFKNRRAQFLFDAAHCRYSVLDVTKAACAMSDLIEKLEGERDAQRDRADAIGAEVESMFRRLLTKGLVES
jgi:hypothetical protein